MNIRIKTNYKMTGWEWRENIIKFKHLLKLKLYSLAILIIDNCINKLLPKFILIAINE